MRFTVASVPTFALLIALGSSLQAEPTRQVESRTKGLFTHATVQQAWKSAATNNKPLLVMFTSDNCIYCRKMMKETYRHPAIMRMLSENTETVVAHARDYRDLVKKLGVRGYPSTLLVSPQGEVLEFMEGFVDAQTFAARISPLLQKRTARVSNANSSVALNTTDR